MRVKGKQVGTGCLQQQHTDARLKLSIYNPTPVCALCIYQLLDVLLGTWMLFEH